MTAPKMETDRNEMTTRLLNLTLEIICLLSGEDYTVVKKTSGDNVDPIIQPPTQSLIHDKKNKKKILELINKMMELLTGEEEESESADGHKDKQKDVKVKEQPVVKTPVAPSRRKVPAKRYFHPVRPLRPLLPKESPSRKRSAPDYEEDEDRMSIKIKVIDEEELESLDSQEENYSASEEHQDEDASYMNSKDEEEKEDEDDKEEEGGGRRKGKRTRGNESQMRELKDESSGDVTSDQSLRFPHNFLMETFNRMAPLSPSPRRRRKSMQPRSVAFRQEELMEIVSFLDRHGYEQLTDDGSYKKKTQLLQMLSMQLYRKFGAFHSKRQIQKRFSDLKVRQPKMLEDLRQLLADGGAVWPSSDGGMFPLLVDPIHVVPNDRARKKTIKDDERTNIKIKVIDEQGEETEIWADERYGDLDDTDSEETSPGPLYPHDHPDENRNVPEDRQGEDVSNTNAEEEDRMLGNLPFMRGLGDETPGNDDTDQGLRFPNSFLLESFQRMAPFLTEKRHRRKCLHRRAAPFKQEELMEMVSFLDRHGYDQLSDDGSYKKKSQLLQMLSTELFVKFGTSHDKRQIQKRYSDLKIRQPKMMESLRQLVAEKEANLESNDGETAATDDQSKSREKKVEEGEEED